MIVTMTVIDAVAADGIDGAKARVLAEAFARGFERPEPYHYELFMEMADRVSGSPDGPDCCFHILKGHLDYGRVDAVSFSFPLRQGPAPEWSTAAGLMWRDRLWPPTFGLEKP